MPASVARREGLWRVIESDGKLARNKAGSLVDGGGHTSKSAAEAQVRAINSNKAKRKMEDARSKNKLNKRNRNRKRKR